MILKAEQITFAYPNSSAVLREASLELRPGAVTGLFGPNGSGKSTLLRCLNGSLQPQFGSVVLDSRSLADMTQRDIARQIAVVPQDTPADVPLTVRQLVMLGRYAHWNSWQRECPKDREIVDFCLQRLGIGDLADRPFSQLSGGERQRTVIARALAQQGKVLLMDEPNTHLDLAHQLDVYRLARALAAEGQAVLIICHDLLVSPLMVDTAVVMHQGQIVASGAVWEVIDTELLDRVFATHANITWNNSSRVCAKFL